MRRPAPQLRAPNGGAGGGLPGGPRQRAGARVRRALRSPHGAAGGGADRGCRVWGHGARSPTMGHAAADPCAPPARLPADLRPSSLPPPQMTVDLANNLLGACGAGQGRPATCCSLPPAPAASPSSAHPVPPRPAPPQSRPHRPGHRHQARAARVDGRLLPGHAGAGGPGRARTAPGPPLGPPAPRQPLDLRARSPATPFLFAPRPGPLQIVSPLPGSAFQKGLAARERLFELLQPRLAEQREALMAAGRISPGATRARYVRAACPRPVGPQRQRPSTPARLAAPVPPKRQSPLTSRRPLNPPRPASPSAASPCSPT
jgi:hypothetical protein